MHRFPVSGNRRQQWIEVLGLQEALILSHHHVCSRHFPNGDITQIPSLHLGKKFASPKKKNSARGQRAAKRKNLFVSPVLSTEAKKHAATTSTTDDESVTTPGDIVPLLPVLSTPVGEPCFSDYSVHELMDASDQSSIDQHSTSSVSQDVSGASQANNGSEIIVNTALLAHIEYLQVTNKRLQDNLDKQMPKHFRLEVIMHDDKLVQFYTGFQSYESLIAFYEFLGPSVNNLKYWGSKPVKTKQ